MKFVSCLFAGVLLGIPAWGFAATSDQAAVNVRFENADRQVLVIEGQTYTLRLDCQLAAIIGFKVGDTELIGQHSLCATLNTGAIQGPGRINIYRFGTQMYEVHLRDLHWTDLDADIEFVLHCYARRVFLSVNVTPRQSPPDLVLGWLGSVAYATEYRMKEDDPIARLGFNGQNPSAVVLALGRMSKPEAEIRAAIRIRSPEQLLTMLNYPGAFAGTRTDTLIFLAGESHEDLLSLAKAELHANEVTFDVEGGTYAGYRTGKGFYEITTDYRGNRSFEEAWINPNQRIEVALSVTRNPSVWTEPATLICNVRNSYGVLEGAVLADTDGFPLPVQVQVSKNFRGENEEGEAEGDESFGEAYVPIPTAPDKPFRGRVFHLFGNWGTHPLKQISSIRFYHHYFHASLGSTETFCYVPFEYPRDDGRNYVLADVRGLSRAMWPDQPQHEHTSVVGFLRYQSGGEWVNNLLQDTRIYLTSPNLANFALDYLSDDGKIKTTLEITELPQDDEARCFVKMTCDVLDTVPLDEGSARSLRFVNAGAYIVNTVWPKVAYTGEDGQTRTVDVPADGTWTLEAARLGPEYPFVAAYAHEKGNMAFVVSRVSGTLGGQPIDTLGASCMGTQHWTDVFLTAPENLPRLEKGDRLEAHYFVMPYGDANSDFTPAERQRDLYGPRIAKVEVVHGTAIPGFPRRLKADPRGFAEFTLTDGDNWTPILIEGFSTYKAPMLWEKRGESWTFHDQQVNGNDWYQSYVAQDGSIGYVFVVKVRPGQSHRYVVTVAPHATSITQNNGLVTVTGGPMDFLSPVKFSGLDCTPLDGAPLVRCVGDAQRATME